MAKYRKRPIVVEANQWFPGKDVPGVVVGVEPRVEPSVVSGHGPYVITMHGQRAFLSPGDWVIVNRTDCTTTPASPKCLKRPMSPCKERP